MNTINNSTALEFLSTFLPENSIALKINQNKTAVIYRPKYSLLLAKIFTFCLLGMVLFSACKKELDVLPSASTAKLNDTLLKAGQPTFYVATTGSDATGNGTYAKPWASLYKASKMVTTSGYLIRLAAGTYTESHVCSIATGVSIIGDGIASTIIRGTYNPGGTPNGDQTPCTILLNSTSAGTNGNQSISYFTLDGGDGSATAGARAITIRNRSFVTVHDMVIKDFYIGGVAFYSSNMYSPNVNAVLETNNQLYNSTIDNCGDTDATWYGNGLIFMSCQKDMLIHDNLLYSNKRVAAHNGNIINGGGQRFRGVKYYNNHSWKPNAGYTGWNFHLEIWGNDGGFEIYNNTFTGGTYAIAPGGYGVTAMTSGHDFDWSIHDNVFQQVGGVYNNYSASAIHLESRILGKTLIYNNTISNFYTAVTISGYNVKNIYVYDNTVSKVRKFMSYYHSVQGNPFTGEVIAKNFNIYRNNVYVNPGVAYGVDGVITLSVASGQAATDFNIYNNTIVADNVVLAKGIVLTVASGLTATNFNIKNNILCYMKNVGPFIISNSGTIRGLHIENNLSYNKANSNSLPIRIGNAISNYTYVNNIPKSNTTQVSPRFVNEATQNFRLQAGSPAINKGINVGLPYIGSAPDISAYEFLN